MSRLLPKAKTKSALGRRVFLKDPARSAPRVRNSSPDRSLMPKSNSRVDAHRVAGWNQARKESHRDQNH